MVHRSVLAQLLFAHFLVRAGNVLEELLDEVDMGEDHATAAIAGQADGVESITRRGRG